MAKRMKRKKCIAVFKKYEKKAFNIALPEPFTNGQYAIKVCDTIGKEEYHQDKFFEKFRHNKAEKNQRASHIIVKTDKKNILLVENYHLPMIFSASMLMGHRWMKACVDNASKLDNNKEFRVTKLNYQGKIYESVLDIKEHFNRRRVPYLFGVKIFFNCYMRPEWANWFLTVRQLGVDLKTTDFPYFKDKKATMYHRDDWPTNFIVFTPNDRALMKNNYKEIWAENPELFLDTIELTHFLLQFKIKAKKLDIEKKNGTNKTNGKRKDKKKLKKKKNKDESEDSNSGPENSDSGPSTMTKAHTPQSVTPGSRTRTHGTTTTNTVTPTSRTPGTTRRH
ncbi:hypothetical protein CAEBREN_13692 [Caenorhabditis brenneri]|uniref:BRCT domain-containing protein n=1 Tax=Caenorhabditis brenneri TaxID=135651 RepID=G0P8W1_CAEBE|nr:hypothetical protein CAEBREN_13692 [Caenorhabditis brenneri]